MHIKDLFWKTHTMPYTTVGDGVDYAFVEEGSTLYIFFQGSNQEVDWRKNFTFWATPYKDMPIKYHVHRGFLECWKQVEDIVIEKITEKKEDGSFKFGRIIVSGYSHGGALATFCHECVWFHRADIRDHCWSYGFEAPRIYAGYKVKHELRERWSHFIMIRNHKDIVTHCPPRLFGFCDVGTVMHIGRFQDYSDYEFKPNLECIKSHCPGPVYNSLAEVNMEVGE